MVTRRIFTPAEFESELNTYQGSAFSVAPKLTQSAWFRPHNRDPHIPGLYLVGAGTHPGAGVPGVINSAKATASVIAEDLRAMRPRARALPAGPGPALEELRARGRLFPPGPATTRPWSTPGAAAATTRWTWPAPTARGASPRALRGELGPIYGGRPPSRSHPASASRRSREQRQISALLPRGAARGMEMDVEFTRYETMDELLLYCYRVAGTVGLMMCHVMGVADPRALRHAAHLGMAMQLTNICRDVMEDWERRHLYLPDELLGARRPRASSGPARRAAARVRWTAPSAARGGAAPATGGALSIGRATRACAGSPGAARWRCARPGSSTPPSATWWRRATTTCGRAAPSFPIRASSLFAAQALLIGLVEAPKRAFCTARHEVPARALRFAEDLSGERVR